MSEPVWETVDRYLEGVLVHEDGVLCEALQASDEAGLPAINVSPVQGKFLHVLARLVGARQVLEIGSLGGYSAIWLGRALPAGGRLISLELDARRAEVARANIARAGLSATVEVRVGPALESLAGVADEVGDASFDLTFIDADKTNNVPYFHWALRLTRPGGAIVVDNVVRRGLVADETSDDPDVKAVRSLFGVMEAEPRVVVSVVQTVGSKGYDGLAIAAVGHSASAPRA
jgi:predicted O-methyltransferase YrrM